jgi:RNA recognition motif-containing protein
MNNSNIKIESNNSNNQSSINGNGSKVRCNLIVNYLPQSLKENDFNQFFSKIGPLKSCKLMFDRQTGKKQNMGKNKKSSDSYLFKSYLFLLFYI